MANDNVGNSVRQSITKTHDLISTSYHEAGHTIYGLLHFMKIESVYVFENRKLQRSEGYTKYHTIPIEDIDDQVLIDFIIKSDICIKYAGLTAETYHFKTISGSEKCPFFLKNGSSDDTLSAAALIKQYNLAPPGRKRYALKKKLINETASVLQFYWVDVTLIAHALFQKKRLYFDDLRILLTKKSENSEFWKQQFKDIVYIHNKSSLDKKELKYILSL